MNRREFIELVVLGGVGLATGAGLTKLGSRVYNFFSEETVAAQVIHEPGKT